MPAYRRTAATPLVAPIETRPSLFRQNTGQRLVEGAMINRSLLALANCINALTKKGS
jgi:hypothetical protein